MKEGEIRVKVTVKRRYLCTSRGVSGEDCCNTVVTIKLYVPLSRERQRK